MLVNPSQLEVASPLQNHPVPCLHAVRITKDLNFFLLNHCNKINHTKESPRRSVENKNSYRCSLQVLQYPGICEDFSHFTDYPNRQYHQAFRENPLSFPDASITEDSLCNSQQSYHSSICKVESHKMECRTSI